ncbi:ABC transporter permease [Chitinophaga niabensis]|uniref:Duplicated orphan permease n=1 Tax=Chitinophaga niabensis TaxID=536979 RepID=A0A1N6DRK6_9BACT|nr:ABC transporter permease [Chitinophaga niabensis]SIN73314.1 duplicated orphan permease [Chitinophaga niabensis]
MLYNNLKIAFRSLWRKKTFSLLNILGLAIGVAASLLIFSVIRNEMSYDNYHEKKDRIFRVTTTIKSKSNGEVVTREPNVPNALPEAFRNDFPQFEQIASCWFIGQAQFYVPGKEEKRFKEYQGLAWADPGLFEMFDFTWLEGNGKELKNPNTVVITESVAKAFFGGHEEAIGKTIQLYSFRIPLKVVGVFKDLPGNTDLRLRICPSIITARKREPGLFSDWSGLNDHGLYVMLKEGVAPETMIKQFPAFVKKYYKEEQREPHNYSTLGLQSIENMHLDKNFRVPAGSAISIRELWSIGLIGIFLLLVACINFINLATAQSISRAKEIGVRKVLGSNRTQLVRQFLNETAVITFFSLVLGVMIAVAAIRPLGQLIGRELTFNHPSVIVFLLAIGVVVTLLAGFYPAVVLSGFNPVAAIKSKISTRTIGGISLRRGLVVVQFVIAQLLVIGTLVVVQQMKYFREKPMGFDKESTVLINLPSDSALATRYDYLKNRLASVKGVENVSLCLEGPSNNWGWQSDFYFDNSAEKQTFLATRMYGDSSYLETFQIGLVAGRKPFRSDTAAEVMVNETMVRKLGLSSPEAILGKTVALSNTGKIPVVGVFRDFNNRTLREEIKPMILFSGNYYEYAALQIRPEQMPATLPEVQKVFTEVYPTYMYDLTYMDERVGDYYKAEAITGLLFEVFAFLAVLISCLGLYGLVSFMAVQKTKEVGVRKVLGASVQNIVYLFSKEFTVLIGIAFLISAPLGYYFMQGWLEDFHYHINLGWDVFASAMVLSIGIAWITVGYKAVNAALANPVKSLRAE